MSIKHLTTAELLLARIFNPKLGGVISRELNRRAKAHTTGAEGAD